MGSPITFSGFNNIDFNLILSSIMQQESQPLTALQSRQASLQSRINNFGVLSSRIGSLERAASALSDAGAMASYTATSGSPSAVAVSASSSAIAGRYDIVVNELARAQVTASASAAPDADTTVVADGGTLTIGGEAIAITGPVTLRQLAAAVNANADAPARASVVQAGAASFRLVLTAKSTGEANAFTITNTLSGGAGVGFTDTDSDGVSGDTAADNAVQATNAAALINNIAVVSATNTLDAAVPGATITLLKKDPAETIVVEVAADPGALKTRVASFVTAYNDLVKFATDQQLSAGRGEASSIGREPVIRTVRSSLRAALTSEYTTGGAFTSLSQAGIEFTRAGTLQINEAAFAEAVKANPDDVATLFAGASGSPGVFASLGTLLESYTEGSGMVSAAQKQLATQISRLGTQIGTLQDRLAIRRAALQQEFTAADVAMSRLKNQSGSIASFGASL